MKLDVEELTATKKRLKIEIPVDAIETAMTEAYKDLNKSVKVDGFRPGKTPRAILEKRYNKDVEANVLERIVPEYYARALDEAKVNPVEKPAIEGGTLKIKKGEPLTFSAAVEIRPRFEPAEYKGMEIKSEPVEVLDSEIDEAVEELRAMHSTLETVLEDRPAVKGDFVVIDFDGYVNGSPIDGGKAENYPLELGSNSMITGFEDQLEGARAGEERELHVKFPDGYRNKGLSGQEASFKVTVKELKKKVLPEVDGELARDLGLGESVEDIRAAAAKDLAAMKSRISDARQKEQIIRELVLANTFELPPSMVENEYRQTMIRRYQELTKSGQTLNQAGGELKEFETQARTIAQDRVRTTLVLAEIAEREGIAVSDAELESGLRRIAAESGYSPNDVKDLYKKREGDLEGLRAMMGEDKVLDFLLAAAKKS